MAESSWPTTAGGRAVSDVQWETMARGFAADGIIGAPTDPAVVYADSTGMQVKIRANKDGLVRGRGWTSGTSEFTKAIGANSSGSTRIDLIVLKLTRSSWAVTIEVKAGTPGAGVPALTQDATGTGTGTYEIALAQVTVTNGASTIAASNVVNVARYIGPNYMGGRPSVISWQPSSNNNWNNTSAPSSDSQSATGMVQALRTTFDKQSPDTSMEIGAFVSGWASSAGRVTCGVRVIGSGYTSSNHVVTWNYYNLPVYVGVDYSAWLVTHVGQNAGDTSGPHGHNIGQHNHGVTIPAQHMAWSGVLHIPNLSPRTYTIQMFLYTNGITFTASSDDKLTLRLAEV